MAIQSKVAFWKQAQEFIEKNYPPSTKDKPRKLPTIKPGEKEWDVWFEYFDRHLGWHSLPGAMRMVITGRIKEMTVPCQWPEIFDAAFTPLLDYRVPSWVERELRLSAARRLGTEADKRSSQVLEEKIDDWDVWP